jgi:tRNA nucleotidyltransferase (CCA-adding enzyme)
MKHRRPVQHIRRYRTHMTLVNRGIRYRAPKRMVVHNKTIDYIESKGGKVYQVGGSVRDELAGVKPKDIDYVVSGIPHKELGQILSERGKLGIEKKGVFKFKDNLVDQKEPDDIVLPRREKATGGGKHLDFDIEYDHTMPIEEDLGRRDFTVNAIAKDVKTGRIIDPFNGRKDLQDHIIRLVNDDAFKDDPLRVLRAGQFASRMNAEIEPHTKEQMTKYKTVISKEPQERIAEELRKGFGKGQHPEKMFDAFIETGVLQEIIPETKQIVNYEQNNKHHQHTLDKHTREVIASIGQLTSKRPKGDRFVFGMAALLHDIGKPAVAKETEKGRQFVGHPEESAKQAQKIVDRLKLSTNEKKRILFMVENHDTFADNSLSDKKLRNIIDQFGLKNINDLMVFRKADSVGHGTKTLPEINHEIREIANRVKVQAKKTYSIKDLAIKPLELINVYKISPGKEIGEIQTNMHKAVITNPSLNNRKDLMQFIPSRYRNNEVKQ